MDTADWNTELDQFFALVKNVKAEQPRRAMTDLTLDPGDIKGERTPCLEGNPEELFPALHRAQHDLRLVVHRTGISWPTQSPQTGSGSSAWPPSRCTAPCRTASCRSPMDYNFYYTQRNASSRGCRPPEDRRGTARRCSATYNDMYAAAYNGNRAPLVLGNHFNDWNNSAYRDALSTSSWRTAASRRRSACRSATWSPGWTRSGRGSWPGCRRCLRRRRRGDSPSRNGCEIGLSTTKS